MKRSLFTLLFCLSVGFVFGQSEGDFRTRNGGNWNQAVRWQVFHLGAWRNLEQPAAGPYQGQTPTSLSGIITILHYITVTQSVSIDQTVVAPGARLFVSGATLTVLDGPGDDVVLNGNGLLQVTSYQNGTLVLGTSVISGTGRFSLFSGGQLQIGSTDVLGAIQNGAGGGNIRSTGTRTYQAGSEIVYNGLAEQYMGNGHPPLPNTTIDNANNVLMVANATINGDLTINSGSLRIESSTITLGGNYFRVGGVLGIAPASSIVINGSGDFGDLVLAHYAFLNNPMNNLTINRAGPNGIVSQGTADLTVTGTFTLTRGNFFLPSTNALTLMGPFTRTVNGTMSSGPNASLTISGSGVLPGNILLTGSIRNLTMDRTAPFPAGTDFHTPSTLTVTNLNLVSGTFTSTGGVSMANGGVITRRWGALTAPLGAIGTYDVVIGAANANIDSGPELPAAPGILNNLTINNTFNVTNPLPAPGPNAHTFSLTGPVLASGSVTITEGTLVTNDFDINVGGNLSVATNGVFQPGASTLTFDGASPQTLSSVAPMVLENLVVNQSIPSTVALLSQVDITNSFGVNSGSTVNVGSNLLTLRSDATTTAYIPTLNPSANISGSVVVQRQLPNTLGIRAYRYIAPPTTTSFVSDWQADFPITGTFSNPSTGPGIISTNPSLYRYDETLVSGAAGLGAGYVNYPSSGLSSAAPLNNGEGYAVFLRTTGTATYDSRGTLRQHGVSLNVTNSGGVNGGWNLLGNPYPAPIDWNLVSTSVGVDDAIYFTDNTDNGGGGGNVSYVDGVGVPDGYLGVIAQGQAFWVYTPVAGTVNFSESSKVAGQTQFFRKADPVNLLRVEIAGQNQHDEIALRLHSDATSSFDSKYDALKFPSSFSLASMTPNKERLVINSISGLSCGETIPLTVEGAKVGSYTLSFRGTETFEAGVTLYLRDNFLNKSMDLRAISSYSFSVNNVNTVMNRFELVVERPEISTSLAVTGIDVCKNDGAAFITIEESQAGVGYTARWDDQIVSEEVLGTGGTLNIPLNTELFTSGEFEVSVAAKMFDCATALLENRALVSVAPEGIIESVEHGKVCGAGEAMILANASNAVSFNWYEAMNDVTPIFGENTATFTTPEISKSKTYYVAAVNRLGCEGERVEAKASVVYVDPVYIEVAGTTLKSNYSIGNQWYFDGELIEGATASEIEAEHSGTYSVMATINGCTTSAAREMLVTALEEIGSSGKVSIFPNPTRDNVRIELRTDYDSPRAVLVNAQGAELKATTLLGEQDIKTGVIDLLDFPDGMYLIRIEEGPKIITKKISKVK